MHKNCVHLQLARFFFPRNCNHPALIGMGKFSNLVKLILYNYDWDSIQ